MIDVLLMSSSRPQLLKYTISSFKRFVGKLSNNKLKYMLHEDFVFPEQSIQSIDIAKSEKFDVIEKHQPKVGLGISMDYMFKKHVKSDYFVYLQDDWEFERPIELDRIIWVMENNPQINLIIFSHYKNIRPDWEFKSKEYDFDGLKLCSYNGWSFNCGVWRRNIIDKKWRVREIRPEGYFTNQFGTHNERLDSDFCYKNIGAYYYGGIGEPRYVRHLGSTWRMADWRLENGKPSGKREWEIMSLKRDRAEWLGDLPKRPLNDDIRLPNEWKEKIKEYPKHIQEIYNV
jgi:hypothetical protein